jgi:ATP-dependent helicase HrpA
VIRERPLPTPSQRLLSTIRPMWMKQLRLRRNSRMLQLRSLARISSAVQKMTTWLPLLFERYHQVRLNLEEARQPWQEATADMRDQLKGLLGEKRFVRMPWK